MDYPTDKIVFFADPHSYWFGEEKIPSNSAWKSQFLPEFGREFWLTYKVLQAEFGDDFNSHYKSLPGMKPDETKLFGPFLNQMDSQIFDIKKKQLAEKWERKSVEALFRGHKFHAEFEEITYSNGFMINPWDKRQYPVTKYPKFYPNESIFLNLNDLPDGGYPELLIFDLDLGLAGQADEVYIQTVGKKRYVDINDHKTGEESPKKTSPDFCYPPFENEMASKHFGYVLQINLYAYMLSLHGFIPRNMAYTFYKDYNLKKGTVENVQNIQKKIHSTF